MNLKKDTAIRESNPREELLDEELIGRAVWECLKEGDSEGVIVYNRQGAQRGTEKSLASDP